MRSARRAQSVVSSLTPTDVLGCLSCDDVMIEEESSAGIVARRCTGVANAGAYGPVVVAQPFYGSPLPDEVAFDGSTIHLRGREKTRANHLSDQHHVILNEKVHSV